MSNIEQLSYTEIMPRVGELADKLLGHPDRDVRVQVEGIVDGVVKVQMLGSCDGCPSSAATLTGGVEEALRRHWPNFRRLEVVEPGADGNGNGAGGDGHAHGGAEQPVQLLQIRGHELE